jgi:hypothetical protein
MASKGKPGPELKFVGVNARPGIIEIHCTMPVGTVTRYRVVDVPAIEFVHASIIKELDAAARQVLVERSGLQDQAMLF